MECHGGIRYETPRLLDASVYTVAHFDTTATAQYIVVHALSNNDIQTKWQPLPHLLNFDVCMYVGGTAGCLQCPLHPRIVHTARCVGRCVSDSSSAIKTGKLYGWWLGALCMVLYGIPVLDDSFLPPNQKVCTPTSSSFLLLHSYVCIKALRAMVRTLHN